MEYWRSVESNQNKQKKEKTHRTHKVRFYWNFSFYRYFFIIGTRGKALNETRVHQQMTDDQVHTFIAAMASLSLNVEDRASVHGAINNTLFGGVNYYVQFRYRSQNISNTISYTGRVQYVLTIKTTHTILTIRPTVAVFFFFFFFFAALAIFTSLAEPVALAKVSVVGHKSIKTGQEVH